MGMVVDKKQTPLGVVPIRTRPTSTPISTMMATAVPPSQPRIAPRVEGEQPKVLDDLVVDPTFQRHANIVRDWMGTDDDIFETLRDASGSMFGAVKRLYDVGKMPPEVAKSYAYVKDEFDRADTGSFNQYLEAIKDYGIDAITDPTLLMGLVAAPFTGGASVAAREAAVIAAQTGVKRLTAAKLGAVVGASFEAGVQSWAEENVNESLGITDSVSGAKILATAAVGGIAGGLLGRFIDSNTLAKTEKVFDDNIVREKAGRFMPETPAPQAEVPTAMGARQVASNVAAFTLAKPSSVLDPATKVSPAAAELQKIFRYDQGREWNTPFARKKKRDISSADFSETVNSLKGSAITKYQRAVAPISLNGAIMDKPTQQQLSSALRLGPERAAEANINPEVIKASLEVRKILDKIWDDLVEAKLVVGEREVLDEAGKPLKDEAGNKVMESVKPANFVPRRWKRDVISKNPQKLAEMFAADGTAPDLQSAKQIVEGMLDIKNELPTPGGQVFNASRVFEKLDDDAYSEFLDNDFNEIMHEYVHQTSVKLGTVKAFGVRNLGEFRAKWIDAIALDYKSAGLELTGAMRVRIEDLYKSATGEGLERWGAIGQGIKDTTSLLYRVSLLPMSTLSSLTEILLPMTKVHPSTYMKGIVSGMGDGFKQVFIDSLDAVGKKHNLQRPEIFKELAEVYTAIEEVAGDSFQRLAGEGSKNKVIQKIDKYFFKTILLTDWTKITHGAAYTIGKMHIKDNLKYLAKVKDIKSNTSIQKMNELADLGVKYEDGVNWLNSGAIEDGPVWDSIKKGGARFASEIVLPTSRAAGTKPLRMSSPKWDMLSQFQSYPTVFSNVVLKNMAQTALETPIQGSFKVMSAALLMTYMARSLNYIRTGGESEDGKTDREAMLEGLYRWGGNGMFMDMLERAKDNMATMGPAGSVAGFFGPVVGDAIQTAAFRKGPVQVLGTKIPFHQAGYTFLGKPAMDDYHSNLRAWDKKITDSILNAVGKKKSTKKSGLGGGKI